MLVAVLLRLGVLVPASASAVVLFTDRDAWLNASGGANFIEDFEGFTDTAIFGGAPLATNHFTLSAVNPLNPAFLYIDTLPLATVSGVEFTTNKLVGFVDEDGVSFEMQFAPALTAWGSDYSGAASGEGLHIGLAAGAGVLIELDIDADDGFIGFVLESGEAAFDRVLFTSADRTPDDELGRGEVFALDNVAGIAMPPSVPAPATLLLLLTALGLGAFVRRMA
ncbi:MAG: hypothetical protein ACI9DC_002771 [Gammaproteobacteria bacterium]|jgi:hypothetical protein